MIARSLRLVVCAALAGALWSSCAPQPAPGPEPVPDAAPRLLEDLGGHHHPITTTSEAAQTYFDQGLILTFGFNHEAAVAAFEQAARIDPACAMCFWGKGLALGPNINAPMGPDAAREAYAATQEAVRLAPGVSAREQAYIEALATRYAAEPAEDRSALDLAFANAMRTVREADPSDVDAAVLLAEALMDLYPWNYWTKDAQPREHTQEILDLLEWAQEQQPQHVGANHYYIHATEEYFPEKAEPAADRLAGTAPDAGHLEHMPSHIYWRVGRYGDAMEVNRKAVAADEQFFSWCRPGAFYRALYYPHNIHFLWAAAAAEGRSEIALTAARKLEQKTKDHLAEFPFLEEFLTVPQVTLARFGKWDTILGTPEPAEGLSLLRGIWHYTRGLAFVRTDRVLEAAAELDEVVKYAGLEAVKELIVAGGTAPASALLEIGRSHLEGEIEAARGSADAAIAALERAVALQDALVYMEPPPWYFPTRQALGAILLDAGKAQQAEGVYRKDLEQYPKNGWSLFGLARSLERQGRAADAAIVRQGFERAFAGADVELSASRF